MTLPALYFLILAANTCIVKATSTNPEYEAAIALTSMTKSEKTPQVSGRAQERYENLQTNTPMYECKPQMPIHYTTMSNTGEAETDTSLDEEGSVDDVPENDMDVGASRSIVRPPAQVTLRRLLPSGKLSSTKNIDNTMKKSISTRRALSASKFLSG